MTEQCRFDRNLFCFFLLPAKEEWNPTHIAHDLSRSIGIAKDPQANAQSKALPKSATDQWEQTACLAF